MAKRRFAIGRGIRRMRMAADNAAEMIRLGRLSAPDRTPFDVVHQGRIFRLRRYTGIERADGEGLGAPILLVPPLMVTSEIYDMAPDVSAVSVLLGRGFDVCLVDFGAPERVPGGMRRTLDDHVLAISEAIDVVRDTSGRDVHLGGYSQGGMFCYQTAAYRRCEGIASVITFGSPVDIHRTLPVSEAIAQGIVDGLGALIERPLAELEGLPGSLTSIGFKLVSPRKELSQIADFVAKLHDRTALEKRESRRRFLGGEGFVAWPGPALRTFVDEYIVNNRLAAGGFVIDGRTVSLADLTCPILCFVGLKDDIARAPAVRAVHEAAFRAEVHEVPVRAGHLGLVVGSRSLAETWPTVAEWVLWKEGAGPEPRALAATGGPPPEDMDDIETLDFDLDLGDVLGLATGSLEQIGRRLRGVGENMVEVADLLRFQLPRLARLRRIRGDTPISFGRALSRQASRMPDQTFFLWKGRAFSYADADRRVEAVLRGLLRCDVRPGQRVGVWMDGRPSCLSIVAALSRLGAVAALLPPDATRDTAAQALALAELEVLVADPAHAEAARALVDGPVLVLGGPYGEGRRLPDGVIDMEAIDADAVALPEGFRPNAAEARDLALILFTAGTDQTLRAAKITNRRWAFSALGAAAGGALGPGDTVYCALPLHHAAGILVAVSGALVGGSRLALASRFSPEHFWSEVRRYGASVVVYAGEMARALVDAPHDRSDANNPVRLFAGSGMRLDIWERLVTRFDVGVLEFYASTEGNAVLANASGQKVGSLGRPLPGATEMTLLAWDFEAEDFARHPDGAPRRAASGEPGVLIARVDPGHPMAGFDGYLDAASTEARIVRDVFEPGDRWFVTGDLLRRDADGDYGFVDRLVDAVRTERGAVFTREVEDALYRLPDVARVVVYGTVPPGGSAAVPVAAIVPRGGGVDLERLGAFVWEKLGEAQRPAFVRIVDAVPMSDGYRPLRELLAVGGIDGGAPDRAFRLVHDRYLALDGGVARARVGAE